MVVIEIISPIGLAGERLPLSWPGGSAALSGCISVVPSGGDGKG